MADLLSISSRMIDSGVVDQPPNRINNELSELADQVSIIESFSHVVVIETQDGLVLFDTSGARTGEKVVEALRSRYSQPVHTIVYTHGHVDHVGGSSAFAADAVERNHKAARVVSHANLPPRLDRYERTDGFNRVINSRQFGGVGKAAVGQAGIGADDHFLPEGTLRPELTYDLRTHIEVGEVELELRHAKGETDDHTWTWIPKFKMISAGDLFIWNFPNCGNPQKVQRYPSEWAVALREMAAMGAELFVPAHGLPLSGNERISSCLEIVAVVLENLVEDVLEAMNSGASLDEIVHSVTVAEQDLALPFLRPLYDEPEFVIRNIWRRFGGWWDGNAASLKPAPDDAVAQEIAALAGGAEALTARAIELAGRGDLRLACHLVEWAGRAEPESASIHATRAAIYEQRRKTESSLMAKGIYRGASRESEAVCGGDSEI